jgi:hypothetical protein
VYLLSIYIGVKGWDMMDYSELVDVCDVHVKQGAGRMENALLFLRQIKQHNKFRVGRDVVELQFSNASSTLSEALASYIQEKNRA